MICLILTSVIIIVVSLLIGVRQAYVAKLMREMIQDQREKVVSLENEISALKFKQERDGK